MRSLIHVGHLRPGQLGPASEVMGHAFQDDPMMRFVLPDEARRRERLSWLLSTGVQYGCLRGEVYTTTGSPLGVAVWFPPGHTHLSMSGAIHARMLAIPARIGVGAFSRLLRLLAYEDAEHERQAPTAHWYLWLLGVEPAHQGEGIGCALLQPVLERADAQGLPCYLETTNGCDLPFYEKRGFRVVSQACPLREGPTVWAMRREPHRAAEGL